MTAMIVGTLADFSALPTFVSALPIGPSCSLQQSKFLTRPKLAQGKSPAAGAARDPEASARTWKSEPASLVRHVLEGAEDVDRLAARVAGDGRANLEHLAHGREIGDGADRQVGPAPGIDVDRDRADRLH